MRRPVRDDMSNKKRITDNPSRIIKIVNAVIIGLLVIFEAIVFMQYIYMYHALAFVLVLAACLVALTVLCVVEIYAVKNLKGRVVIYVVDFTLLLVVCAFTGSTYLSALYCVILTQIYMHLADLKTKAAIFAVSCAGFVATCITGWSLNNLFAPTLDGIIAIVSGGLVGVIILAVHFVVANFLISFYNTNVKLKEALKRADESRAELEKAYEQLSENAALQERNRIARDIHDNAGHSMTAVIMQTEAAKLLMDTNPAEAKSKIISANMQAKNALEQMRESVHLLAGRNTSRTLKEELEEILAQTTDGTNINIRADIADAELVWAQRHFIANSLKESLSNGIRHGGATAFYVELTCEGEQVRLTVSDNGKGLPQDFKEGFGIRGMRERAAAWGGSVVLESEPDEGCEIHITITADSGENGGTEHD